jgi:hypothetical protein
MSNIPNHSPAPPLSRSRRTVLLLFAFTPFVGYTLLKIRQRNIEHRRRLEEEEGRRAWIQEQDVKGKLREVGRGVGVDADADADGARDGGIEGGRKSLGKAIGKEMARGERDLSVGVGRSGGGV